MEEAVGEGSEESEKESGEESRERGGGWGNLCGAGGRFGRIWWRSLCLLESFGEKKENFGKN